MRGPGEATSSRWGRFRHCTDGCCYWEAGNNAWLMEFHALETDPDAERIFMHIVTSAQRL